MKSEKKIRFVAGYQGGGEGGWDESDQKVFTSGWERNMFYGFNTNHTLLCVIYVHIWKLLTVNFKSSHHKEKYVCFFLL